MSNLSYVSRLDDQPDDFTRTAVVPPLVSSKTALLEVLARELQFPSYFGMNWDALDECLADLSWIREPRVVIQHGDLPLTNDRQGQARYLRILNRVCGERGGVRLAAVFPAEMQTTVEAIVDMEGSS